MTESYDREKVVAPSIAWACTLVDYYGVEMMEHRVQVRNLTADQLQKDIDGIIAEFKSNADLRKRVSASDLAAIESVPASTKLITVRREGAGFEPATTAIIVAFAPVAAEITLDVWKKIILPRLIKKYGENSIKESNGK